MIAQFHRRLWTKGPVPPSPTPPLRFPWSPARWFAALAGGVAVLVILASARALFGPPLERSGDSGSGDGESLAGSATTLTAGHLPSVDGGTGDGAGSAAPPPSPPLQGDGWRLDRDLLSVTDAVPAGEGWVLLDGRSASWLLIDGSGMRVVSGGGRGRGPGELDSPAAIALLGDTLVVVERTLGTLERYRLDGTVVDRVRLPTEGCEVGFVRRAVVARGFLHLLRECLGGAGGGSRLRVERWEPEGRRTALLHERPWRDPSAGTPFRPGRPVLAGEGDRLLFGDAQDGCLRSLPPAVQEEVCHPDPPEAPLTRREQEALERARRVASLSGLRLEAPPHRVPFDEVFLLPGGRTVFRTVLEEDARRLDLLEPGGRSVTWPIEAGLWTRVGPRSILLAREGADGTEIRLLPLP